FEKVLEFSPKAWVQLILQTTFGERRAHRRSWNCRMCANEPTIRRVQSGLGRVWCMFILEMYRVTDARRLARCIRLMRVLQDLRPVGVLNSLGNQRLLYGSRLIMPH